MEKEERESYPNRGKENAWFPITRFGRNFFRVNHLQVLELTLASLVTPFFLWISCFKKLFFFWRLCKCPLETLLELAICLQTVVAAAKVPSPGGASKV